MNKTLLLVAVLSLFGANASAQQYFTKTTPGKYIYKVVDYSPAPGQFVNKLPMFETGDDATLWSK